MVITSVGRQRPNGIRFRRVNIARFGRKVSGSLSVVCVPLSVVSGSWSRDGGLVVAGQIIRASGRRGSQRVNAQIFGRILERAEGGSCWDACGCIFGADNNWAEFLALGIDSCAGAQKLGQQ